MEPMASPGFALARLAFPTFLVVIFDSRAAPVM